MVEPTIKLAIVGSMAKEPLLGRPSDDDMIRQPLLELHDALLHLHKVLLDSERAVYEATVGPIRSPNHFFQLPAGADPLPMRRGVSLFIRKRIQFDCKVTAALTGASVASIRVERDVSFRWVLAAVWVGGKPQDDQQFSLYSSSPHKWPTSHI